MEAVKVALQKLRTQQDLVLVLAVLSILLILFSPIPAALLDLLILVNFAFALTMLLLTFYVTKPVDFSTFPSLLLIATLFRLALNVAATRLIMTGAEAGHVIRSIGQFAVQGSFIIGFIVFLILIVVQYVVVTSGAQRVSEVAARFVLDAMPGQQMSIDADLNMGLIDQGEAKRRRKDLEREAGFYGSMDGASKFVKGDAIAGILILLIDIVGGFAIGVAQMGMPWREALETFTLLTIGDGIVTQIPALVIAVATGILVTRSAADNRLSNEVAKQLGSTPKVLAMVGIALFLLMLLPGMPKWPMLMIAATGAGAWWLLRRNRTAAAAPAENDADSTGNSGSAADGMDPIEVAFGPALALAWQPTQPLITQRLQSFRDQFSKDIGLEIPACVFRSSERLEPQQYEILLHGDRYGQATLYPERTLAIHAAGVEGKLPGIKTQDPAFGLPALWIENEQTALARTQGFTPVDPVTVFVTHVSEVLRANAAGLLSRSSVMSMLEAARMRQPGLVEELVPNVLTVGDIQHVLQALLEEGVSIRNLDLILEVLVDHGRYEKDPGKLCERVRERLGHSICQRLLGDRDSLTVMTVDPLLEQSILDRLSSIDASGTFALPPRIAEDMLQRLLKLTESMLRKNLTPILLCRAEIRRPLRTFTQRVAPRLVLISMNEVPNTVRLHSFGVVSAEIQPYSQAA